MTTQLATILDRTMLRGHSHTLGDRLTLQRRGTILILILIVLIASIRYGAAFYWGINPTSFFDDTVKYALIALAMTFVIMKGGIDLSVGSVVLLSGVVAAHLSSYGLLASLLGGLATGAAVGAINGALIAYGRLEPFVVTLAAMLWARGLGLQIASAQTAIVENGNPLLTIGSANWFGLSALTWLMFAAFGIGAFALKYSAWARRLLAIGGNEESAELLGVPTTGTKLSVYVLSGTLAGLAGIVLAAQTGSVSTDTGTGWELIAIAAVVVGGTLLSGGIGSVVGTLVGLILMQLIFTVIVFENGLGTVQISSYWQSVIRGAFLLIVVLVQARVGKKKR